jgi:hypothetical protein
MQLEQVARSSVSVTRQRTRPIAARAQVVLKCEFSEDLR